MSSNPPPTLFFTSSYGDDAADDAFAAPQLVTSADGCVAFVPPSAPLSHDFHSGAGADDDDDDVFAPKTTYRDTHHAFASGMSHMVFESEALADSSFFSTKSPVFVLESQAKRSELQFHYQPQQKKTPVVVAPSPLSPSSYLPLVDVPLKEAVTYHCVNPSFPSQEEPAKIMAALAAALRSLECEFEVVDHWTLRVSLLCVAELITFSVALARVPGTTGSYQVDFLRRSGCEAKFCQLTEHIRGLCSDVDADAMPFLVEPLEAWCDATQETNGRQYAIPESEARNLLEELNCDALHPETLMEVTKVVKDRCRHKGNRKLFLQTSRADFLAALKWMLASSDDVARFAIFILTQFAKDGEVGGDYDAPFFASPFDKSAFALLLEEVASRHGDAPCGKFTTAMVEHVQQSWIFC